MVWNFCENVLDITICSFLALCWPWHLYVLAWFTLISGTFLRVSHLTVAQRLWAYWLFIAYSLILLFMCDSSMIASLKLDFVLFEITFSICICRYDWGKFLFHTATWAKKSHPLMSTLLLALCAFLLVFVVAPYLQYTWPVSIFLISLLRSSGATLLFELGLLWSSPWVLHQWFV